MKRHIIKHLLDWKNNVEHLPLLLRGARQIGKTYIVREFAAKSFEYFVEINFELEPDYAECFTSLKPKEIINKIGLKQETPIIPGKTLLFLDEIQNCPAAIMALRYFKEKMPDLHVIGAGSLLEFALEEDEFRMPVGRVQCVHMYPLTFAEFLLARNKNKLLEHLHSATLTKPPAQVAHDELIKLLREYFMLGGMPAVLNSYIQNGELQQCQNLQSALLATYRSDFGKYAKHAQHRYLVAVFNKIAALIGKQVKYSFIDPDSLSRDLKTAVELLAKSGLLYKVIAASCSGLPLNAALKENFFKLVFVDIGLVNRAGKIDLSQLLSHDLTLFNQGALAEQFVGQELLAMQNPFEEAELYYWSREKKGSQAEIDYVIQLNNRIIPIEVKSGKTGTLRSLHQFIQEKKSSVNTSIIGIKVSQQPLEFNADSRILSLPMYMIHELGRIIG